MTVLDPQIQIASTGIFGLGLQATKGVPRTQNELFNYFPVTSAGYGLNQGMANLPPEMGLSTTPRGSYKTGVSGDGQVTLIPRLVNNFGKMLLMLMGKDAVTADTTLEGVAVAGVHTHTFTFSSNEVFLPYASARRVIPGPRKLCEVTQDIRFGRGEINFPAVGPMSASLQMAGRVPNNVALFVNDPDIPMELATIAYELDDSFANGVDPDSTITIMGQSLKCTGLAVSIMNELAPGDQTRHVGSQTPFDYPVLSRTITVRATVFFTDKELYQSIIAGLATDATTWDSAPLSGDVNFTIYSPDHITGSIKRGIQFRTTQGNVKWGLDGPLALQPRQMMMLNLTGTVVRPAPGRITSADNATSTFTGTNLDGILDGETVTISGMLDAGNNGTFTADGDSTSTTLTVVETLTDATVQNGLAVGPNDNVYFEVRMQNEVSTPYTQYKVRPNQFVQTAITAATEDTGTYTFSATSGLLGIREGDLVQISGMTEAANNGIFTAKIDATDTTLTVVEAVVDDVPGASGARATCETSTKPAIVTSFTAPDTITGTGFVTAGIEAGDAIVLTGGPVEANNGYFTVDTVNATTITTIEQTITTDALLAPEVQVAGAIATFTSGTKTITGTLTGLKPGYQILVTNAEDAGNNKLLTIATINEAETSATVEETITTNAADTASKYVSRNVVLVA